MTPADRRITELIDKWLASIDLHLKYVELSDAAYARAQAWPKHDRPTRWVLEVARQKVLELKSHARIGRRWATASSAESLELMAFLANLVGIQHIQRFIPLADPARADATASRKSDGRGADRHQGAARARRVRQPMRRPAKCRVEASAAAAKTLRSSRVDASTAPSQRSELALTTRRHRRAGGTRSAHVAPRACSAPELKAQDHRRRGSTAEMGQAVA